MPDGCVRAGAGSTCTRFAGQAKQDQLQRWGTKNPGRLRNPRQSPTCPLAALVRASGSHTRVSEIQLDGGTAIRNMQIQGTVHLLHRIHRVVLLSSRERLWLAQSPTRVFISEVTRRLCAGRAYIISWKPPNVNRFPEERISPASHRFQAERNPRPAQSFSILHTPARHLYRTSTDPRPCSPPSSARCCPSF